MIRRPWMLPFAVLLVASLAVLPACNKKKKPANDDEPAPANGSNAPPAAVSTDHLFFAHLKVKDIRDSSLFAEIKDAVAKAGGTDVWDKALADAGKELGFNLLDLETVSVAVAEIPERGVPKLVLILTSSKPFDKTAAFKLDGIQPNARGLYQKPGRDGLIHFPDEKTAVMIHPELVEKYLNGYGKDNKSWPLSAELMNAASENTFFMAMNLKKLPDEAFRNPKTKEFASLQAAESVTFTANLRRKELHIAARAKFPDESAAGKAKEAVENWIGTSIGEVARGVQNADSEAGFMKPALVETQRALKEAKVEVSGSDLTLVGSYKANFDIPPMVNEAVKWYREAVPRIQTLNYFKQCALALHNIHHAYEKVAIHTAQFSQGGNGKGLSWRVAMLPFLEQDQLYKQFKHDEPWDSEHNKKLIEKMPKVFTPVPKPGGKPVKPGYTHIQMVIGPKAMPPVSMTFVGIVDGTANTIALVEAAEPVIWTKPDDVMFPDKELPKDFRKKFGGQFTGGFIAAMWDGSVVFVSDKVSDRTLSFAFSPWDGEPLGNDWPNGPQPKK